MVANWIENYPAKKLIRVSFEWINLNKVSWIILYQSMYYRASRIDYIQYLKNKKNKKIRQKNPLTFSK